MVIRFDGAMPRIFRTFFMRRLWFVGRGRAVACSEHLGKTPTLVAKCGYSM